MDSYIIYVIDTETTGLIHSVHDVIEISAIRLIDTGSGFTEEQKTWLVKALNPSSAEMEALKINGHKLEDISWQTEYGKNNYVDANDVVADIEKWILEDGFSSMDRIFAGQNPIFDIEALKSLWKKTGNENTFPFSLERNNRIIDTKQIAAFIDVCNGKRRLRYDLSGLVKSFGIKKGKAHRAAEDTKMTADLLVKFITGIQAPVKESFKDCYLENEGNE